MLLPFNMNTTLLLSALISLPDGGPVYAETNLQLDIVEPYNAFSSLAYLLPALFWMFQIRGRWKDFSFLVSCLPFLILGGIGSTLYHAFRNSSYLLYLDVFPIALLTLCVSIYFWLKVLPKWWQIFLVLIPFILSRYIMYLFLRGEFGETELGLQTAISISYFITGVMIFLPSLLLMKRLPLSKSYPAVLSCLLSILGLLFRELETWNPSILSMGTHWLWHISTAVGAGYLGLFLYNLREKELERI